MIRIIRATSTRLPYTDLGYGLIASDRQVDGFGTRPPRPAPAGHLEQPVQDASGESPDQHAPDPERRTHVAAGVPHPQPVLRIGEFRDGYPLHPGHLGRIPRVYRM